MDDPKADILFQVVKKFADIDLSNMGTEGMGYVFEDLIRRFAEQSNETAGEHFTPREVIKLMVNVLFNTDSQALTQPGIVKTLYDPACGTGGMLSIGEQHLKVCPKNGQTHRFAPTYDNNTDHGTRKGGYINKGGHTGPPLHAVVQWFKTMTTNEYIRGVKQKNWQQFNKKLWQRNYYEHIIRSEKSYLQISEYIRTNSMKWYEDKYYEPDHHRKHL